jgi:DNA polymerase delta subunit 2
VGHVKAYKSEESEVVLVGVLFKDMVLKPNVLNDIQNNLKISDQFMQYPSVTEISHKVGEQDLLFIEDMEARLQLNFVEKSGLDKLPTGLVVAILGKVNDKGFLNVHDLCLPGYAAPAEIPRSQSAPEYVAFLSGLQLGSPKSDPMPIQLLRDFLMGVGMNDEDKALASSVVRVVVAGDSLYLSTEKDPTGSALSEADVFFCEIASIVPVDLMSGPRDPVNYCLPQQPLHSGLFPEAKRYKNMNVRTNPFKFKIGQTVFLGTSGQNVSDVVQFTSLNSGIEALDLIAQSRYMAPTAPDTTGCYPFTMKDPLVMTSEAPHFVFAGNQLRTECRSICDGRGNLACISDFSLSPSLLLVNVHDVTDFKIIEFASLS